MQPPTKTYQTHKVRVIKNKPVFYEPPELAAARSKLTGYLALHVPPKKYTGPVRLVVKWLFPLTGKHREGEWRTSRPDTDNLQKMLKDIMTQLGYWVDDALVVSEITEKFWAVTPGIYVYIADLERCGYG